MIDPLPPTGTTEKTAGIDLLERDLFYFNGYQIAVALGDLAITLTRNGRPVATLNCSYTVGKSFAGNLQNAIHDFETKTGHTLMTVEDITKLTTPQSES